MSYIVYEEYMENKREKESKETYLEIEIKRD
jgi:hypothetical protein